MPARGDMYFRWLQILRGFAALAVVLYHIRCYADSLGGNNGTLFRFFDDHFSYGAWFFFTVSGFLMAYLVDSEYPLFLPRRLLRIYPTYIAAVVMVVFAKVLVFGSITQTNLPRAMLLLPQGTRVSYPLMVEWTLVYEVFFYLVCAIFTIGRPLRRAFPFFLIAWSIAIAVCMLHFQADGWLQPKYESWFLPGYRHIAASPHNLLFIAGGLCFYVYKWWPRIPKLAGAVLITAGAAVFLLSEQYVESVRRVGLLGISFALVVYAVCAGERPNKKQSGDSPGWLERFGDYSYALYLIHVSLVTIVLHVARHGFNGQQDRPVTSVYCAIALVLALLAGWWFGKVDLFLHGYFKQILSSRKKRDMISLGHRPAEEAAVGGTEAGRPALPAVTA
jgi:peptidoglycan/LPS O-acetylase OafA/YrhL